MKVRRVEFIKLTRLTREAFDARSRRKHFPFRNTDIVDGSYPIWQAYLTLIADDFNENLGMDLTDACQLASALSRELQRRWRKIVTTSQFPGADIFCGRLDLPFSEGTEGQPPPVWKPVVGTLPQISREVRESSVVRVALTNASKSAAVLHSRAVNADLDLTDFWKTP
jgi:hypothetical protein